MAYVGTLAINVVANTERFRSGLHSAGRDTARFSDRVMGLSKKVAGLGMAITGLGSMAGVAYAVKKQFALIDTLAKTSDKLGIATEDLGKLRYAAELSGVEVKTLDMALQRMTRRLSEASHGGGEAIGAITELGLDPQRLAAISPDKAFSAIAEAMAKVTNQSDKVRLSFKFFDSEGVALVNTLALGKKGLRDAGDEAERLGMLVTRFDAAKIEQANDSITRMKGSFGAMAKAAALEMAPIVDLLGAGMTRNLQGTNAELDKMGDKFTVIGGAFDVIVDAGNTYKAEWKLLAAEMRGIDVWVTSRGADLAETVYGRVPGLGGMVRGWKEMAIDARQKQMKLRNEGWSMLANPPSKAYRNLADTQAEAARYAAKWRGDTEGAAMALGTAAREMQKITDRAAELRQSADKYEADLFAGVAKRASATWKAGQAMFAETRTPLEQFKTDLADVDKLLKVGAIDADTAARKFQQLRGVAIDAMQPDQPDHRAPTFVPAMERGSLEAYDTIVRNASPARMRDPAEDTAAAARKILELFPQLVQSVDGMSRKLTKPGTVEMAP